MPDSPDLEFPATIHLMQIRALSSASQLEAKLAATPNSTHIEIRSEAAANLVILLRAQSTLLTRFYEENATILDAIEKVSSKTPKQ